jgi:hypothetical protein
MARVVKRGRLSSTWCPLASLKFPVFALAAVMLASQAHADTRFSLRLGVEPLALEPTTDTPYVGGHVQDAVTAYNTAVTAYNRAHGFSAGSPMSRASINSSDLGLHATLFTFAPGVELGGNLMKFRVEGLLGTSDHVRAYGIGVYPIDLALPLGKITPYFVAGGTLRWLSRSDLDGEVGGLGTIRAAAGTRIGQHIVVELGVGLLMLGGVYNSAELQSMSSYDPRGMAPPPPPDHVVSGGTQSGMIDVSVGFSL